MSHGPHPAWWQPANTWGYDTPDVRLSEFRAGRDEERARYFDDGSPGSWFIKMDMLVNWRDKAERDWRRAWINQVGERMRSALIGARIIEQDEWLPTTPWGWGR